MMLPPLINPPLAIGPGLPAAIPPVPGKRYGHVTNRARSLRIHTLPGYALRI
jgi:hypothetical protein